VNVTCFAADHGAKNAIFGTDRAPVAAKTQAGYAPGSWLEMEEKKTQK